MKYSFIRPCIFIKEPDTKKLKCNIENDWKTNHLGTDSKYVDYKLTK